jgi:Ca-activated chloride channel family protein
LGESPSVEASASAGATASAAATVGPTGPASLDAPQEVAAGAKFEIEWTGPRAYGDYITIVAAGATRWTDEPYFYATGASPGTLVAPVKEGAYALWYVSGADDAILAQRAIRVLPFVGDLGGPEEVMAGSRFEVAWNGPNGPGDYVTIVKVGSTRWTNESYFYTADGNPGELFAVIEPGAYELWYVTGADDTIAASKPITVTPYVVTLDAAAQVAKGATFEVEWTGPDGPSDYITIVPAGAAPGTFLSYAYTNNGSPVTLTAPDTAGNYEIRYQSDRSDALNVVFSARPITVH